MEQECRRQLTEMPLGDTRVVFRHAADREVTSSLADGPRQIMLVRGEAVYDPRLYRWVWESPAPAWVVDRCEKGGSEGAVELRPIGLAKLDSRSLPDGLSELGEGVFGAASNGEDCPTDRMLIVDELATYLPDLRRHLRPYWCLLRTAEDRKRAGHHILDSAQKGVLDFPARFLHPMPENLLARSVARTPITPNQITVFTGMVAFAATYLFATGSFGWGLATAFLVNVLDGVDGKLARVKLQATRYGDRLDHILDVAFEFSWYVGLGWGLLQAPGHRLPLQVGVGMVGVMAASRAVSGIYKLLSGRQIHDHRSFDRAFRLVAGRRNIYTVILLVGLVAGRLEEAFYLSFGWGVATLLVYVARTIVPLAARSKQLLGSLRT